MRAVMHFSSVFKVAIVKGVREDLFDAVAVEYLATFSFPASFLLNTFNTIFKKEVRNIFVS